MPRIVKLLNISCTSRQVCRQGHIAPAALSCTGGRGRSTAAWGCPGTAGTAAVSAPAGSWGWRPRRWKYWESVWDWRRETDLHCCRGTVWQFCLATGPHCCLGTSLQVSSATCFSTCLHDWRGISKHCCSSTLRGTLLHSCLVTGEHCCRGTVLFQDKKKQLNCPS